MNKSSCKAKIFGILILLAGLDCAAQVQTFCSNFDGNIACSSYDSGAASQTYCTSMAGSLSCTTYGSSQNYNQVSIQRNYDSGQIVGTALGNLIVGAIQEYREHKRKQQAKRILWDQFVQDTLAKQELDCETKALKASQSVLDCRNYTFIINQFLHRHQSDFVPDAKNMLMLADALDKVGDNAPMVEQTLEIGFGMIDKRKLDKKIYLGKGDTPNRQQW